MICKTSLSAMFRGVLITEEFIYSILGTPIEHDGEQIGVISMVKPEIDMLYMDINDRYKSQFEQSTQPSYEIIDRYAWISEKL